MRQLFCLVGLVLISATASAVEKNSDYLDLVKAYAEAMIEGGRDTYGKVESPLFAAVLDRQTMKIGKFPGVKGVRGKDRSQMGANPQEDVGLYHILYDLSEVTGDPQYAAEADKTLKFFFENCQSPKTHLMAWGEHIFWNLESDGMGPRHDKYHEINGEWPFWDRCFELAPDPSWKFALGLWDHQVADQETGDFSRHALWVKHGPGSKVEFPRYAGQMILNWAEAYAHPVNANRERREELLTAIEVIMGRMEANMKLTKTGYLPSSTSFSAKVAWPDSNLELARCLYKAMPMVPPRLVPRMKALALKQDTDFHSMPNTILDDPEGAIATEILNETGEPYFKKRDQRPYSKTWTAGYGLATHADMANLCYQRYVQLQDSEPRLAEKYRDLILATAEVYLTTEPNYGKFLRPDGIQPVIELLINTYELSRDKKYLERAGYFAEKGIELFLDDVSPLPKASNRHQHYESITGGPAFMKTLLDLHRAGG